MKALFLLKRWNDVSITCLATPLSFSYFVFCSIVSVGSVNKLLIGTCVYFSWFCLDHIQGTTRSTTAITGTFVFGGFFWFHTFHQTVEQPTFLPSSFFSQFLNYIPYVFVWNYNFSAARTLRIIPSLQPRQQTLLMKFMRTNIRLKY